MSPVGLGTKNYCACEGQQQFSNQLMTLRRRPRRNNLKADLVWKGTQPVTIVVCWQSMQRNMLNLPTATCAGHPSLQSSREHGPRVKYGEGNNTRTDAKRTIVGKFHSWELLFYSDALHRNPTGWGQCLERWHRFHIDVADFQSRLYFVLLQWRLRIIVSY
jgi:hypothetical protein